MLQLTPESPNSWQQLLNHGINHLQNVAVTDKTKDMDNISLRYSSSLVILFLWYSHSLSPWFAEMFWTAPELMRQTFLAFNGTSKADVFSFGIMMRELVYNCEIGPYHDVDMEPKGEYVMIFVFGYV